MQDQDQTKTANSSLERSRWDQARGLEDYYLSGEVIIWPWPCGTSARRSYWLLEFNVA